MKVSKYFISKYQSISGTYSQRGGSRTAATSKMELFVIIVNGFQPLTIMTKCSILDVATVLDLPLSQVLKSPYYSSFLVPKCLKTVKPLETLKDT